MTRLVIWGASGHASVVADIVRLSGDYEIAGFLEDGHPSLHVKFCGSMILGGTEQLDDLRATGLSRLILAIGDCRARMRLADIATNKGFTLATAIHPRATIAAGVCVGAGTVIAAGAVLNPGTRVGSNVIINTSATVDHNCEIADGAHVGPGCHVGGWARIGSETWLGIGAIVRDRIVIGRRTVVGAGAVVVRDLSDDVVAYGVPAKVVRRVRDEVCETASR